MKLSLQYMFHNRKKGAIVFLYNQIYYIYLIGRCYGLANEYKRMLKYKVSV